MTSGLNWSQPAPVSPSHLGGGEVSLSFSQDRAAILAKAPPCLLLLEEKAHALRAEMPAQEAGAVTPALHIAPCF